MSDGMENIKFVLSPAPLQTIPEFKVSVDVSVKPEEPKAVSVNPVEEAPKTEELKKEDKKVEAKAEKQTSEKK